MALRSDAYDRTRVRAALLVSETPGWGWLAAAVLAVLVIVGVALVCSLLTPAQAATVAPAAHGHRAVHHKWNTF